MAKRFPPEDLGRIRTYPIAERPHKFRVDSVARPVDPDGSLASFLDGLPRVLAADGLRALAGAMADARRRGRPVALAIGAHVIKTGLSPLILQLMDAGLVQVVAVNGAGAIHDWELAAVGETSEDVAAGLRDGRFGTVAETGRAFHSAARRAAERGTGLGEELGAAIEREGLPHREHSILAGAYRRDVPVTVHVAIGCDVVHVHPDADGGAIGAATFHDFRRLVAVVRALDGGVWINVGSAVQLPEVFLKALSAAANLDAAPAGLTTANLDMMRHYRTGENVLRRPTAADGEHFEILGHHEIVLPLLVAAAIRAARTEDDDR